MRTAFAETLCDLAARDESIWLLTGDLGFSVLEPFRERFPGRFVNAGVAEQNMTGMAAGLALSGKIVFTYSIANFPTMRCMEQIRNDVCYHRAAVKIVAVGGGMAYGAQGYTHHGVEDLAVMRALPHMIVAAPGDPLEARAVTGAAAASPDPCYIRLGRSSEPVVHEREPEFEFGEAIALREGSDATLVSTGGILKPVADAARILEQSGTSVGVLSMPTVKPLDGGAVATVAERCRLIVTVEEHSIIGGLGSAVAEEMAELGVSGCRLVRLGLPPIPVGEAGSQGYLRRVHGLDTDGIVAAVRRALRA